MASPQARDLLILHRLTDGYVVLDALSQQQVAAFTTFAEALSFASRHTEGTVWHQTTDNRGRPMGDAIVVFRKSAE